MSLAASPHISPHLPISPHISPYQVLPTSLAAAGLVSASRARNKALWARVGLLEAAEGDEDDPPVTVPSAAVRDQPVDKKLSAMCFGGWGGLLLLLGLWQALGPPWCVGRELRGERSRLACRG